MDETPGMKFALGDSSSFLMVNKWPRWARRLFILMLPASIILWIIMVFVVVYVGMIMDVGYGLKRLVGMWR